MIYHFTEGVRLPAQTASRQFPGKPGCPSEEMACTTEDRRNTAETKSQPAMSLPRLVSMSRARQSSQRCRAEMDLFSPGPQFPVRATSCAFTKVDLEAYLSIAAFLLPLAGLTQIVDSSYEATLEEVHTSNQLSQTGANVRP